MGTDILKMAHHIIIYYKTDDSYGRPYENAKNTWVRILLKRAANINITITCKSEGIVRPSI